MFRLFCCFGHVWQGKCFCSCCHQARPEAPSDSHEWDGAVCSHCEATLHASFFDSPSDSLAEKLAHVVDDEGEILLNVWNKLRKKLPAKDARQFHSKAVNYIRDGKGFELVLIPEKNHSETERVHCAGSELWGGDSTGWDIDVANEIVDEPAHYEVHSVNENVK